MYPNEGKRSGAYSQGAAYDVHPYILMNYNGKFDDVSTLAHELGHTMQSYLSNKHAAVSRRPTIRSSPPKSRRRSTRRCCSITCCARSTDDDAKLSLLGQLSRGHPVHGVPADAVRRVRAAHARDGRARVSRSRATRWPRCTSRSRSATTGTTRASASSTTTSSTSGASSRTSITSSTSIQYATAFTASEALAARVKSGDADATRRYLAFLSAGGSKYPIDLLKDAGVDMTTDEPLDLTMRQMSRVMDEMERILDKRFRSQSSDADRWPDSACPICSLRPALCEGTRCSRSARCARRTATWWPSTTCRSAVAPARCVGLLGPNGAGKTTTVVDDRRPDRRRRRARC